jgi:hypothetical protein
MGEKVANDEILPKSKEHDDAADKNCESHFINFPLFYALLPNIKL